MRKTPAVKKAKLLVPFVMTENHKYWEGFCNFLEGPRCLNFLESKNKNITWKCYHDHRFARAILKALGADVDASISYFESRGGYCDCEILFNVGQ